MNDFFHISSLKENCELAMAAFNEINHFNDYRQKRLEYIERDLDYTNLPGYGTYEENPFVFLKKQLDEFLISTARISKILWPIRKKYISRGENLRKILKIDDDQIIKNRQLRDAIEHKDEKLDDWLEKKSSFKIGYSISDKPLSIVQVNHSQVDLDIDSHILYHFDRLDLKFYFKNQIFDIKKMYKGVQEIHLKLAWSERL